MRLRLLQLKQVMNLKAKGRYLEETIDFMHDMQGEKPTIAEQKKVIRGFSTFFDKEYNQISEKINDAQNF